MTMKNSEQASKAFAEIGETVKKTQDLFEQLPKLTDLDPEALKRATIMRDKLSNAIQLTPAEIQELTQLQTQVEKQGKCDQFDQIVLKMGKFQRTGLALTDEEIAFYAQHEQECDDPAHSIKTAHLDNLVETLLDPKFDKKMKAMKLSDDEDLH